MSEGCPPKLVLIPNLVSKTSDGGLFIPIRSLTGPMDPEARIIAVSEFTQETSVEQILRSGARKFVDKPFSIIELLTAVRQVLDE